MKNIYKTTYINNNLAWHLVKEEEVNKLLQYSNGNKSVLEIGLGNGFTTELLSDYFKEVIAVDISVEVIKDVKQKLKNKNNITFVNSSIDKLSIPRGVDNFYLGHLIEHLPHPIKSLISLYRNLKRESIGLISVPNSNSLHRQIGASMGMLKSTNTLNENDRKFGHRRLYDVKKLKTHVQKAGYKVMKIGGCFLKVMTYSQINQYFTEEMVKGFIEVADNYPEISGDIYAIIKKEK